MNLAELFQKNLHGERTAESVRKALASCDREMVRRWGTFEDEKELERVFFPEESKEQVTDAFWELMDFWEVYRQYDGMLEREEGENILILQIVYEADGNYQCIRNKRLLEQLDGQVLRRFLQLCGEIEGIYHSKSVKFLIKDRDGLKVKYEMTMEDFEEKLVSYNYAAVQNRLLETMETGGLAVVIAGSKGLTPQRLYGFVLDKTDWSVCPDNILALLRDVLLAEETPGLPGDLRGQK